MQNLATAGVRTRCQWTRAKLRAPRPLRETTLLKGNLNGKGVPGVIRLCREWHSGGIIFPRGTCADVPLLWAADVLLCEADGDGMRWNERGKRGKMDEERK